MDGKTPKTHPRDLQPFELRYFALWKPIGDLPF